MNSYYYYEHRTEEELNILIYAYAEDIEEAIYKKLYPNPKRGSADLTMYPRSLFIQEGIRLISSHPEVGTFDVFDLTRLLNKKHEEFYKFEGSTNEEYFREVEECEIFARSRLEQIEKKKQKES